ncbi:MAG: hypothetical protein JWO05_930 [Gemmatimonadetes bacterium]|nr:hypothetical protein [Gemmatimonadota bacterium]
MSGAERAYRLMLRAYPPDFRARYGREMALLFLDLHRESRVRGVRFWAGQLRDVARSAPALQLEAFVRGRRTHAHLGNGTMMTMAILAIMIGAIEAVNASQEVYFGSVNHDGYALMGGTMGVVAGLLLFSAGVAVLRRSERAASFLRASAITCLAVFAFMTVAMPLMSGASTLLGIGFPIVVLAYMWRNRARGESAVA